MQKQSRADAFKIGVLKNFANFTEKPPVLNFIFNKVADLKASTFIKKTLQCSCFPLKFAKFLRIPFSTGHLQWLLLYMVAPLTFENYPRRHTMSFNVNMTSYDVVLTLKQRHVSIGKC